MFGSNKKQERAAKIAKANRNAAAEDKKAREHAKKIAGYKKSLKSGSSDPAADRYMIRQHQMELNTAQHNAREFRKSADFARKRWF